MSQTRLMVIAQKRVEMHPDLVANFFAQWRFDWARLVDKSSLVELARSFNDDGLEICDAVNAAKDSIIKDNARNLADRFWAEYRARAPPGGGRDSARSGPSEPYLSPTLL